VQQRERQQLRQERQREQRPVQQRERQQLQQERQRGQEQRLVREQQQELLLFYRRRPGQQRRTG